MAGIFALVGVILLALAGFNIGSPRVSLGWLGLAFVALAITLPAITTIAG